ncbi:ankyrin repeat domain-containing protein [Ornithinibacillus xuwenensis]|uniref:Ankyrin repeat domain-containing protein n=1 Tax=Ornithinibacillus xuwenensis TaxID=3144668 RepID=A0ABU9XMU4_9BACI
MKRLNHLERLDEHLKMMPKPNLTRDKKDNIKHAIQNTRIPAKPKRSYKAITTSLGAIVATVIFAFLIYGNLGHNPQSTSLNFSDLVEENIDKIVGTFDGEKFSSEEGEIIELFSNTVGTMELTKTKKESLEITHSLELYSAHAIINTIHFGESNLMLVDGKQYEVDPSKWEEFKKVFFTEQYQIDEEDTEKSPLESEDASVLLEEELAKSPRERNWEKILAYVKDGANPDRALLFAAEENNITAVTQLLQEQADPNTTDESENTPLMLTSRVEIASILFDYGADIELRNERGYSALVIAVYGHHTQMVQKLLELGANPNTTVQMDSEISVLWMAGKYNDQSIRDLLIQHGATLVDGYDQESWMISQFPWLTDMLEDDLLSYAATGRLPGVPMIQIPSDPNTFANRYGEPFETITVNDGIAQVYGDHIFIKPGENELYTSYRYELNPGDVVKVANVENVLGEPSTVTSEQDLRILSYNLEHYELQFTVEGSESYSKEEARVISLELIYKQPGIVEQANNVLTLLQEQDMNGLAEEIHPDKGVIFAPYLQIQQTPMSEEHEPINFQTNEIPGLLNDSTIYNWGVQGASGLPIEMTAAEYFDNYVYTKQEPDVLYVNEEAHGGTEYLYSVREVYPDAQTVEYFYNETQSDYDLSWAGLMLIFEPYQGEWKLVGIVHNAWTP